MNKQLIGYVNALSVVVFMQAIELENQHRALERNTETLIKCRETIEALMEATFGKMEVYEQ